MLIKTSQLILV